MPVTKEIINQIKMLKPFDMEPDKTILKKLLVSEKKIKVKRKFI